MRLPMGQEVARATMISRGISQSSTPRSHPNLRLMLTLCPIASSYSFQWLHRGLQWQHPQATTYHGINSTISPQDLRNGRGGVPGQNGFGSLLMQPLQRWMQQGNMWDAAWVRLRNASPSWDTRCQFQTSIRLMLT